MEKALKSLWRTLIILETNKKNNCIFSLLATALSQYFFFWAADSKYGL